MCPELPGQLTKEGIKKQTQTLVVNLKDKLLRKASSASHHAVTFGVMNKNCRRATLSNFKSTASVGATGAQANSPAAMSWLGADEQLQVQISRYWRAVVHQELNIK